MKFGEVKISTRISRSKQNKQKNKGQIKPWINWGIGEVVMENCLGDGENIC